MKNSYIFYLLIIILGMSCQAIKNIGEFPKDLNAQIDEIQEEIFPVDSLGKKLIMGLLEGAATEASTDNIDTLSKRLVSGLTEFLNERLGGVKVDTLSKNLVTGLRESINDPEFQKDLNQFISNTLAPIQLELDSIIAGLFEELSSPENLSKLEKIIPSLLTENNSIRLTNFLNKGLEGVSFQSLSDSLRNGLLNGQLRDSLQMIVFAPMDSTLSRMYRVVEKVEKDTDNFFQKHLWTLITGIGLLMSLGFLYFNWRQKIKNRNKSLTEGEINNSIMAAIHAMGKDSDYDALTTQIKNNALQRGIESQLNQRLQDLGLSKSKKLYE